MKIKDYKGITLIAMIITIIVMLVLAGVSMNAIVGDNGILNNAINATTATSIAVLQEYLQELYVENYDSLSSADSKVEALANLEAYTYYFYNPYREHGISNLSYVVTSDGYALYLINKSQLPEEIQDSLVGGDAGDGTYADYVSLNDVYGVTSNLKVYYCSNGVDSITGLTVANLEVDNPARKVTINNSGLASVLSNLSYITQNTDGTFSAQELRSITDLTIDSSSVTSLSDLYNLSNLQILTISGISLSTLLGIENCPKLYHVNFYGSTISNYTALGKLGSKLQYLYFYNIDDDELETACSTSTGIGKYDLPNLKYFAVVGNTNYINNTTFYYVSTGLSTSYISSTKSTNIIKSIEPLNNLTETTKKAIQYMSLQNNDIKSLSYLSDFTSLILLRAEYNSLTTLDGIENITSLKYLCVAYNSLTSLTTFASSSQLDTISLEYNSDLTTLSGLANCTSLYCLVARGCNFGYGLEVTSGKLSTDSLVSLYEKTSLYCLDVRSSSNLIWIDYISECSNLVYLRLDDCTNMASTSMAEIKSLITSLGENASYPSNYGLAMMDSNSTYLNLEGESLTQNEFETIGIYTKLTHLSLKDVVITENDENSEGEYDEITDSDALDNLFASVLSKLTAMKYLQLYGVSNLTTIDFVENMEKLIELDVRYTSIIDLTLLEEMTEKTEDGESTFALKTLAVNVSGTDLSTIPKTISNMGFYSSGYYWTYYTSVYSTGLLCDNYLVWNTLANSLITSITVHYSSASSGNVDLSSCIGLLNFICYSPVASVFILPSSVVICYERGTSPVFTSGTCLEYWYVMDVNNSMISGSLPNLSYVHNVVALYGTMTLDILSSFEGKEIISFSYDCVNDCDLSDFYLPSTLETLSIGGSLTSALSKATFSNVQSSWMSSKGTSLTSLTIRCTTMNNLVFLNGLSELKTIDLSYNTIMSIEGITSALSNVSSLDLSYNNLISLYGIQYFTALQILNLSYNTTLGDTCSYDGTTYNNLQLLTNLYNTNSTLKTLTLTGCTGITTDSTNSYWTTLTGLSELTVTGP